MVPPSTPQWGPGIRVTQHSETDASETHKGPLSSEDRAGRVSGASSRAARGCEVSALNKTADVRNPLNQIGELTDTEDRGKRRRNMAFTILSLQEKREYHLLLSKAEPCVRLKPWGQLREAGARRGGARACGEGAPVCMVTQQLQGRALLTGNALTPEPSLCGPSPCCLTPHLTLRVTGKSSWVPCTPHPASQRCYEPLNYAQTCHRRKN